MKLEEIHYATANNKPLAVVDRIVESEKENPFFIVLKTQLRRYWFLLKRHLPFFFVVLFFFILIIIANAAVSRVKNPRVIGLFLQNIFLIFTGRETVLALLLVNLYSLLMLKKLWLKNFAQKMFLDFDKSINLWSYAVDSVWSVVEEKNEEQKLLKIQNSVVPLAYKPGWNWIDYALDFMVRVAPEENEDGSFACALRLKSKSDGLVLEYDASGKTRLLILRDGEYHLASEIDSHIEYQTNEWLGVKIEVKGNAIWMFLKNIPDPIIFQIPQEMVIAEKKVCLNFDIGTFGFCNLKKQTVWFKQVKIKLL